MRRSEAHIRGYLLGRKLERVFGPADHYNVEELPRKKVE